MRNKYYNGNSYKVRFAILFIMVLLLMLMSGVSEKLNSLNLISSTSNAIHITTSRDRIVEIALSQIGTVEIGGNTNNIKYNDWYAPSHKGFNGKEEYCAIFLMWCFKEIGMYMDNNIGPPFIDSASCTNIVNEYMKYGRFVYSTTKYIPRSGDLILFTKGVKTDNLVGYISNHIGLITKVDKDYIYTVEGNTSIPLTEFQSSGNGVYNKKYPRVGDARILGYVVPWYEGEEEFMSINGIVY